MTIYKHFDTRIMSSLQEISINEEVLHQYLSLVNRYIENPPKENYEKHHILPKSLFPEYGNLKQNKWNSVKLPYGEHLEAHYLLSVFTNDAKMILSFRLMIGFNKNTKYNKKILNQYKKQYEEAKEIDKNYISAKDKNNNIYYVLIDDPRILSGELFHTSCGQVTVKDKNGKTFNVYKNDPLYISGELVSASKGKITVVNPKTNKTCKVEINDSRLLSGELLPYISGKVVAIDKNDKKFLVYKNDSRLLSGELTQFTTKGYVTVRDKLSGKTFNVKRNDPRIKSGELEYIRKGFITVRNVKTGETFSTTKNDPRLETGEIIFFSTGMKLYNNGITNKRFLPTNVPTGWKLGGLKVNKKRDS